MGDIKKIFKDNKLLWLCLLVTTLVLPLIINVLISFKCIPSKETDGGAWLGFWGSFLGSIFGGITTLVGVLLTISQMEREKKDEFEKQKPIIVPLKKKIYAYYGVHYKDGKRKLALECYNNKIESGDYYGEGIYIDLINVGMQHALNVIYSFEVPSDDEINRYIEENHDKNREFITKKNEINKKLKEIKEHPAVFNNILNDNTNIQIIKSSEVLEKHIILEFRQEQILHNFWEIVNEDKPKDRLSYFYVNKFPLGSIGFKYTDILGKEQKNLNYKMYLSSTGGGGFVKSDKGQVLEKAELMLSFVNIDG